MILTLEALIKHYHISMLTKSFLKFLDLVLALISDFRAAKRLERTRLSAWALARKWDLSRARLARYSNYASLLRHLCLGANESLQLFSPFRKLEWFDLYLYFGKNQTFIWFCVSHPRLTLLPIGSTCNFKSREAREKSWYQARTEGEEDGQQRRTTGSRTWRRGRSMSATFNWRLNCLIRISISTEMSVIESQRSRILI